MSKSKKALKGGFSDEVTNSLHWKRYTSSSVVGGYIGTSGRSPRRDQIVERLLREQDLGPEAISNWLSSTDARHLLSNPGRNLKEFEKRAREYTKDAFLKILVWSHPDHTGMLASTIKLEELIERKFSIQSRT